VDKRDKFKLKGNTIAGTFRVDDVVAEGGFGIVYRAFHLHFRAPVALKCLKIPGELSEDERKIFLEQFRSEAEIQFRLSAALPNIVRPLHVDAVRTDSGDFIPLMALEWLEGLSFETIIEKRTFSDLPPMSLRETMELIGPAAEALHQAHNFEAPGGERLAVIHRDIKPDNLFLTEINGKKVVKILDFGISKVRRAATQLAGHFSQTAGTAPFSPAYGAPEQWVPKRFGQTGPWTDVWGLALTLVEIIKGDAAIVGDHQAMMGTALDPKVRPSPRSEGVSVSDEVESVFLKALSLDPRFRYQSIEAFWQALQAAVFLSGDGAREYEETPSGSRILLPPMSAPTPWKSPADGLFPTEPIGSLPPMLAPAALKPTALEDQPEGFTAEVDFDASYPIDPHSDLQPVLPAPTNWSHFDPEIPPSSGEPDHLIARAQNRSELLPTTDPFEVPEPIFSAEDDVREPSLKLELASTSTYPKPSRSYQYSEQIFRPHPEPVVDVLEVHAPEVDAEPSPAQAKPAHPAKPAKPPIPRPTLKKSQAPSMPQAKRALAQPAPTDALIPDLGAPSPHKRSVRPPPPVRTSSQVGAAPPQAKAPPAKGPPPPPARSKRPPPPSREAKSKDDGGLSLIPTRSRRSIG